MHGDLLQIGMPQDPGRRRGTLKDGRGRCRLGRDNDVPVPAGGRGRRGRNAFTESVLVLLTEVVDDFPECFCEDSDILKEEASLLDGKYAVK